MKKKLRKHDDDRPVPPSEWWIVPPRKIARLRSGHIVTADALETLRKIRSGVADICFIDPPFNLGKRYSSRGPAADRKPEEDYAAFISSVVAESARVLRPGGALFYYHIPKRAVQAIPYLSQQLDFRHWIAIGMKNGFVRNGNLYPAHYALLHFTKGSPLVLNRPKVQPSTCPHCGEVVRDYGGYADHVSDGVNLSDFWDDISPVRHAKYKYRQENELPLPVVKRVVELAGRKGGLLVDVFSGTGAAAVAARYRKMKFIAIDREAPNTALIAERMEHLARHRKTPSA